MHSPSSNPFGLTAVDSDHRATIASLQHSLRANYQRLFDKARSEWEHKLPPDPSDACVTVRIHSEKAPSELPCAGVLEKHSWLGVHGSGGSVRQTA